MQSFAEACKSLIIQSISYYLREQRFINNENIFFNTNWHRTSSDSSTLRIEVHVRSGCDIESKSTGSITKIITNAIMKF